jgi:hypothetical protein
VAEDAVHTAPTYGPMDPATRLRSLLLAPFGLVALPRVFYDASDPGVFSHLGFLFLALPMLALVAPGVSRATAWTGLLAALWYALWAETMQYVRYLLPLLPLLALVGGDAAVRMGRLVLTLAGCAVAVQGALSLGYFGARLLPDAAGHPGQWACATNAEAREEFLTRQFGPYASEQWINHNTPKNVGVVLYEEVRGFYLDRPYLWGNRGHSLYIPYDRMRTGRDLADWFLAHGTGYALVNLQMSQYPEVTRGLREALSQGAAPELFLRWYNPEHRDAELWPMLLGDAVRSGAARIVPEASLRGCIVLQFLHPAQGSEGKT